MIFSGVIERFDGKRLVVTIPMSQAGVVTRLLADKAARTAEIRLQDGREITNDQRRKVYALIRAIANWCGHFPEEIKEYLKFMFEMETGTESFSLSSVDVSTASEFIDYLIEFCVIHGVPFQDGRLIEYAEDQGRYIYACLASRVCAVHGTRNAEIHHCTGSRVGMGRSRGTIVHEGLICLPLCRACHNRIHIEGERSFFDRYKVHGIPLDRHLCECLGMKTKAE